MSPYERGVTMIVLLFLVFWYATLMLVRMIP